MAITGVTKPTVKFQIITSAPQVGRHAIVVPIDHPDPTLNRERVSTGKVVRLGSNGMDFETLSANYVYSDPAK